MSLIFVSTRKRKPLSSRDVAHLLDMCPDEVVMLARKGTLKAVKQGRLWQYNLSSVLAYRRRLLAEQARASGQPI